MSVAIPISARVQQCSLTVRQFRLGVLTAFAAVAVGCAVYIVEKYLFAVDKRFVENPTDVMVRAFGMAHFLIAWLFMATSPRFASWPSLGRLGVSALIGGVLCYVYAAGGASRNPLMAMAFYSFFLVHEIRDQGDLFIAYGDGARADRRVLNQLRTCVCLTFVMVLAFAYLINGQLLHRNDIADRVSPQVINCAVMMITLTTIFLTVHLLRTAIQVHGSIVEFASIYRPLFAVYGGILTVLLLGSVLGSVGFNLIILMHATSWLLFVRYQLAQRERTTKLNAWRWLRSTPHGFVTLHLVLVAVVLVLLAMRVYVWQRGGAISVMLSTSSFPYWGFMHIAMSFARGR